MFETCLERVLGVAWRQPRVKWSRNRHDARHFVFYHLFYTHTLTLSHDCLLPHALIQSFARMLLALVHSLALLPTSPTHSIAYLLSVFFPPSLPPSFTNSLVCLLSPSFLPFNSSLDFKLPLSLTHTFLLLYFLTKFHSLTLSSFSSHSPARFPTHSLTNLLIQ